MKPIISSHKAVYAAFDLFPTSKGASTHISHMASYLSEYFDGGLLYTLGNKLYEEQEVEGKNEIIRFNQVFPNYLDRAHAYSHSLEKLLNETQSIKFVHFRDVWSGLAVFQSKNKLKSLFEVNGLPSIELPYRYPGLSTSILEKLKKLEDFCLQKSSFIITPSETIKENLLKRNISSDKIEVVPNAAEINPEYEEVAGLPENYIIYFGAVQPWQGINNLLKAFALIKDYENLQLVICCSNRAKQTKIYRKIAEKLEISDRIIWNYQLSKPQLNYWIKNALLSFAPLTETERNISQGCSPLKIFESMTNGTAVIASDLPVSREIITDKMNGRLIQPDRPQVLARTIRILLEYPEHRKEMEENALKTIKNKFNWDKIREKMFKIYSSQF